MWRHIFNLQADHIAAALPMASLNKAKLRGRLST